MKQKFGISILNYITWEKTIECVDSILNTYTGEIVIVVVDNASPNDSYEKLKSIFSEERYNTIELISTDYNGGFSKGNNFGIHYLEKKGVEYCIVANNDVTFRENSIKQMFAPLVAHEERLLVSPKIFESSGKSTTDYYDYKQTLKEWICGRNHNRTITLSEQKLTKVHSFSGCCFALNMKNFASIGYFDENVFLYCEEAIVSEKAYKKRFDIVYNPKSVVVHNHGTTTGKNSLFTDKEFLKSLLYYLYAYEHMRFGLFFMWLIMVGKFTLKIILGKYSSRKGYRVLVKETFKRYWQLIWKGI